MIQTGQNKSNRRIQKVVGWLIFLAALLIIGNLTLGILANYKNHPYLFFFEGLLTWALVINPFIAVLLLWVSRRHSIACRLGQNNSEEMKEAAMEKNHTSRRELCLMFAGLSLLFFVVFSGPATLLDLPYLVNPPEVIINSPHMEHYESIIDAGVASTHTNLEGLDADGHSISLLMSNYAENQFRGRKHEDTPVRVCYMPHSKKLLYFKKL